MIKIAEGSYKLANQKGLLTPYLIWCTLKSYNPQGTIKRDKEGFAQAAKYVGISTSSLSKHIKKLVELDVVKRNKYSYSLSSYDKIWAELGLDITENKARNRKGTFCIFKFDSKESLREQVEIAEIQIHVKRQAYKAKESILKDKTHFSDEERNALKGCSFQELPCFLDKLYVKKHSVLNTVDGFLDKSYAVEFDEAQGKKGKTKYVKITPYLTCKRTSIILGYKDNCRTGHNVRGRIEKAGLASFKTREVAFQETKSWEGAVKGNQALEKAPSRIREENQEVKLMLISEMIVHELPS